MQSRFVWGLLPVLLLSLALAATVLGQAAGDDIYNRNYGIGDVRGIGPGRKNGIPADEGLYSWPLSLCYLGQVDGDLHAIASGLGGADTSGGMLKLLLNDSIEVDSYEVIGSPYEAYHFFYGFTIVSLTDLNSDGKLEVAVVAPSDQGSTYAYIYSMNSDGSLEDEPRLMLSPTEPPLNQFSPFSELDYSEWYRNGDDVPHDLTYLGDLDGDGVGEIVLSGPRRTNNYRGEIYVVYMNADLTIKDVKTITSCHNCTPDYPDYGDGYDGGSSWWFEREVDVEDEMHPDSIFFGSSVTGLGDLDGDNIPDLAVGMEGAYSFPKGAIFILFLNSNATVKAMQEISIFEESSGLNLPYTVSPYGGVEVIIGNSTYFWSGFGDHIRNIGNEGALTEAERFGPSMDWNHDQVPDLLVTWGFPTFVWLMLLNPNGTVKGLVDLTTPELYGEKVSPAADLNGDNIPDFMITNSHAISGGPGTIDILLMSSITVNVTSTSLNLSSIDARKRQSTGSASFLVEVSSAPWEEIVVPFSVESTSGIDPNTISVSVDSPLTFLGETTSAVIEVTFEYPEQSTEEEGLRVVLEQPRGAYLQQGQGSSFLVVNEVEESPLQAKAEEDDKVGAEVIAPVVVVGVLLVVLVVGIIVAVLLVRSRRARKNMATREMDMEEGQTHYYQASALGMKDKAETKRRKSTKKNNDKGMQNWFINRKELEFIEEIGQGAFGVVWKGAWRQTEVAIKKLHTMDDEQLDSFQHEAQLMRNLRPHPNVVQLMGLVEEDGMPECIVTEFLANGDLLSYLRKQDTLPPKNLISMAFDVAAGMAHLHAEGITHRDLAARNLLMTEDLNIKVSDFGLSRKLKLQGAEQKTKQEVGPLKWMSPEAIQESIYSEKSDVWSYGICLWEIVTLGEEPFGDTSVMKAAVKICNEGCKALRIPKGTPEVLKEIILSCWQVDPKDRPTFAEITKKLESASL
ncbi:fibroblast growth factor receptor 3-like [Balamuthia mandrillaris]